MTVLLVCCVILLASTINLSLNNEFKIYLLANAPELRQIAFAAVQNDFREIPVDHRWRMNAYRISHWDPPYAMFESPAMLVSTWFSPSMQIATFLIKWSNRPITWTITVLGNKGDKAVEATIGGKDGLTFREHDLTSEQLKDINRLTKRIVQLLNQHD